MTQKELLYMEDAINHEKDLKEIFISFADNLEDEKLCAFLSKQAKIHQDLGEKLKKVMEDIINE